MSTSEPLVVPHVQHVALDHPTPGPASQTSWTPSIGPETVALLQKAVDDDGARGSISKQAAAILGRCNRPDAAPGSTTGLVVGYVQSGKTLSFTTLMALAHDNGFPLVVLLAGTKQNLFEQTAGRLAQDLRLERPGGLSPWYQVTNPGSADAQQVAQYVQRFMDPTVKAKFRRTTVLTVMKNPTRLRHVKDMVASLALHGVDPSAVPVLVIDDEADQAGLNAAVQRDDETATYAGILALRDTLAHHSYVMYTATPQAPLLVNLADVLSPDFVRVLDAGSGYTGGDYFFGERHRSFVRILPADEVREALDTSLVAPPESLKAALAIFLLGLAVQGEGPVSMLVHPSHTTELHGKYEGFVRTVLRDWSDLLTQGGVDRDELVAGYLRPAHASLVEHADDGRDVPPLEELLEDLPDWIGATHVRVVNSGTAEDGKIAWNIAPAWILIGGNKLDRGFTVEGLSVTYMPRGMGVGNADTIQQRARFFGYKKSYGDLCRVWLPASTADAFDLYVEHERVLRKELKRVAAEGINLREWTRTMLLDPRLKPCRRAVVDLDYLHGRVPGDSWASVSKLADLGTAGASNLQRVNELVSTTSSTWEHDPRDKRLAPRRHQRATMRLDEMLEQLLVDWRGHVDDRAFVNQAVLLLRARLDDQPDLLATVFLMDGLEPRDRALRPDRVTVNNLQQGASPDRSYPGDKVFYAEGEVTVQVHSIRVRGGDGAEVPGLSVRVPAYLAGGVLVQHGDGS